jgi:hypothetical protein
VGESLDRDYNCFVHFLGDDRTDAQQIAFQQDHGLPKPTSQWRAGEVLLDGPHEATIPKEETLEYDLVVGLFYPGGRVDLAGPSTGDLRVVLGKVIVTRDADLNVTGVKLDTPQSTGRVVPATKRDFRERLSPQGSLVDFGLLATDGSVKVERQTGKLVVLPYPRETHFVVKLDVGRIAGAAVGKPSVKVEALAAGTKALLGPVACTWEGDRLVFEAGVPGAGRYVVSYAAQ